MVANMAEKYPHQADSGYQGKPSLFRATKAINFIRAAEV